MSAAFLTRYPLDADSAPILEDCSWNDDVPDLVEFLGTYGGRSFGDGVYRTIDICDRAAWAERLATAFDGVGDRVSCFSYDWLGRAFALDPGRLEDGHPGVVMLEPGTREILELPVNLRSFHQDELIHHSDAALATDFYRQWRATGGQAPTRQQVVGYRTPLFLGGADQTSNLHVSDLDIYWIVVGQVIQQL